MLVPQLAMLMAVTIALLIGAAVPALSPSGVRRRRTLAIAAVLVAALVLVGYATGTLRGGATVRVPHGWLHAAPGLLLVAAGALVVESERRRGLGLAMDAIGLGQAAAVVAAKLLMPRAVLGYAAIVMASYLVAMILLMLAIARWGRVAEPRGFDVAPGIDER